MTSTLTAIQYSGRPNPTVTVDPLLARQIWALLDDLPVTMVAIDLCWKCLEAVAPPAVDALLTRLDGDRQDWAFLTGNAAVTRRGSHPQATAVRTLLNPIITSIDHRVAGAVPVHAPTTTAGGKAKADWRRCHHATGYHSGDSIDPCRCGSPADASTWLPSDICLSSNCYNYAVKDVWCRGVGGLPVGATPVRTPSVIDDYGEWSLILGADGLVPVADHTVVPHGMSGGWHVALAVSKTDFHFLRLDGSHWSQKYGPRPPQTCDAGGAAIPADGIHRANLCAYRLVGYFYVPRALAIDH